MFSSTNRKAVWNLQTAFAAMVRTFQQGKAIAESLYLQAVSALDQIPMLIEQRLQMQNHLRAVVDYSRDTNGNRAAANFHLRQFVHLLHQTYSEI